MLSSKQIEALFNSWDIPAHGREYIEHVRSSEPARLVGSGRTRNTPERFASQRMGRVIQAESATVEGALVRMCEYDYEILEYWDQPKAVPLVITDRRGRRQRTTHTPDYLIIRATGPTVVECKTRSGAEALTNIRREDWRFDGNEFSFEPAVSYFSELGISHKVWTPDDRSQLRSSNIDLLLAVRRWPKNDIGEKWRLRITRYLAKRLIASISDLRSELHLPDAGAILRGIHDGWLYAPLDLYLLSCPEDGLVALTARDFELGMETLEAYRTESCNPRRSRCIPNLAEASIMIERKKELEGVSEPTRSKRTMRRYKALLRHSNGDVHALLPRPRPGNRLPRLTADHECFLQESISAHHASPVGLSVSASYLLYKNAFDDKKASGDLAESDFSVSLNTYASRVRRRDQESLAFAVGGKRAANSAANPVDRRHTSAPTKRPFESAQADHYLGDRTLALCSSGNRRFTQRPWVSVLRDSCTGEVLALTVGFRAPGRKVLAELLRDCARRHQRLPESIASDCGSDFESTFYESTLALYGVHKKDRPSGAPRFGGELERLFGTLKTSILWQHIGSTRNDMRGRSVSPSHRGHRLAEQDLIDFYHELESSIFEQLNVHIRGEGLNSPDVIMGNGQELYPMSGVPVSLDQDFLVATSIDAPKRMYLVDRSRGINVLGRWYWGTGLAHSSKRRVEVRMDSWDENLVYAWLDGGWLPCRSRGSLEQAMDSLTARICRTTLRLDGRAELAEARHEADLSLARHLSERERVTPSEQPTPFSSTARDAKENPSPCSDDIPSIAISWNSQS